MVEIRKGEIGLRDDRIDRVWNVKIGPFLISKYPVTQKSYFDIAGISPSSFKGDNLPVENISWIEAIDFCNLLSRKEALAPYYTVNNGVENIITETDSNGYRLPSEAEWEEAGTMRQEAVW